MYLAKHYWCKGKQIDQCNAIESRNKPANIEALDLVKSLLK